MRPTVNSKDERIRVLRIITRMNVGGPAIQITGLMRYLDSDRFEQILLKGACGEDEIDYMDLAAKDILATEVKGLGRSISPLQDVLSFFRVARLIRKFKPHIVHTHTAKAGVIGRLASLLSLMPSSRIHTFHGHLLHGYFSERNTRIIVLIEKFLTHISSKLVAVGSVVAEDLISAGVGNSAKFTVITPGLELSAPKDRNLIQDELGIPKDSMVVSFVGRITAIKRPDRFLDVIEQASFQVPNLLCLVAGEGDLLDAMKEQSKLRNLPIMFLGWRGDVENIFSVSDITILTSDNEGTPLSLIQAGMLGVPVISTNVGSVSTIVQDGKTGLLVDTSTPSLLGALVSLCHDEEFRIKLGNAAMEFCISTFGVSRLVREHELLYQKEFTKLQSLKYQ